MTTQPERIASLETHEKFHWMALVAVATIGCAWLSWASVTLFSIKADLQALKQDIADHGFGQIVADLKKPKSADQLRANLTTITAQIQTDRVEGKQPDKNKVDTLSKALAQVIQRDPQLPEAWQAAGELISYRSSSGSSEVALPPCQPEGDYVQIQPMLFTQAPPDRNLGIFVGFYFQNCTLVLDGPSPILQPSTMQVILRQKDSVGLVLTNVHVVYHGGDILPVRAIAFTNCTFDFQLYSKPPSSAPNLMNALLTAPNPHEMKFLLLPQSS